MGKNEPKMRYILLFKLKSSFYSLQYRCIQRDRGAQARLGSPGDAELHPEKLWTNSRVTNYLKIISCDFT